MANRSLTAAKAAAAAKLRISAPQQASAAADMYSNQAANIGWATTSAVNAGRHIPFRISLDYQKLVFMYRGSWVIRKVIDTKPQDQIKQFPTLLCDVTPEDISDFEKVVTSTATLQKYIEGRKWGRLFGGALGIIIIKGDNDLMKPLRIEDIEPDTYRGLIIVDRWSGMSPSSELITDLNNPSEYGLPVYYDVYTEANQSLKVHHSRCLRFVGRDLPLFEKQIETYWGMSEVEAILDELQRYDFGMAAVSDLISRANVLAMKEPMLAQMLSGLNLTQQQLVDYAARMTAVSEAISTNGILALGEEGELFSNTYSFSGLSEVMKMQMTALCGAAGYPFSRLFGDTQTGLGQSNEGDLQNYYDSADQERRQKDRPLFDKLMPIIAMSTWGEVPDDLDYAFPPIRTMNSKEKAELAKNQGDTIKGYFDSGILGRQTILREIKTLSAETGIGSNVTDEMIEAADDDVQTPLMIEQAEAKAGTETFEENPAGGTKAEKTKGGKDSWFGRAWKRISGARDAEFVESEHPRDEKGRFAEAAESYRKYATSKGYTEENLSRSYNENNWKEFRTSYPQYSDIKTHVIRQALEPKQTPEKIELEKRIKKMMEEENLKRDNAEYEWRKQQREFKPYPARSREADINKIFKWADKNGIEYDTGRINASSRSSYIYLKDSYGHQKTTIRISDHPQIREYDRASGTMKPRGGYDPESGDYHEMAECSIDPSNRDLEGTLEKAKELLSKEED